MRKVRAAWAAVPREINPVAAAGDLVHLEALRFEPGGYFGNVTDGEAEAVAELFGGEPFAVVGRSGKLLLRQKGVDCRGRLEEEGGVADGHGGIDRALIVVRNGSGMDVTLHGCHPGAIHRLDNAVLRGAYAGEHGGQEAADCDLA